MWCWRICRRVIVSVQTALERKAWIAGHILPLDYTLRTAPKSRQVKPPSWVVKTTTTARIQLSPHNLFEPWWGRQSCRAEGRQGAGSAPPHGAPKGLWDSQRSPSGGGWEGGGVELHGEEAWLAQPQSCRPSAKTALALWAAPASPKTHVG